ncbi:NAD(P)/FAD-dependent oxidoreductase [Amycolatopsis sp. ATCC 39116]|uniref:FAD-dependent oxidoreductase n=1 Tax=Amycolatopsis sp. (strain ATCC 39116 / 75iv2) TaxID=385957 RepID=UPI00026264E1|nr:NAD(P)/FAD-dependent oxidoreductase [Amycolatopsis sp. ATCC 39116]
MSCRVIIVGAGLGGLTLAQSLHAAGIDVAVYERDPHPFARGQGYRIHLDPEADHLLRDCLPRPVHRLYRETSGLPGGPPLLMTEQLVALDDAGYQERYQEPVTDDAVVDRLTFRQVLTAGLGRIIHYGKAFTSYELLEAGVRAHFADGSAAEGDVLVGADGANSAVRGRLLPDAPVFDSGLRLIYGKTPLTAARRSALPDAMAGGFAIVAGPESRSMALGWQEFRDDPDRVAARLGFDVRFRDTGNYLMWGLTAPAGHLPDDLARADGETLLAVAREQSRDWHPVLGEIIAGVSVPSLVFLPLRTSLPRDCWPAGPVSLLGDAAHAMFPAGSGTLAALRDASLLLTALRDASGSVADALDEYQRGLSAHAWAEVRESYRMAERLGGRPWPGN